MKVVKVGRVGEQVQEVALGDEATINDALIAAGLTMAGNEEMFLNHAKAGLGSFVYSGDVLILERRKVSDGMIDLIDYLVEEDIVEYSYIENDWASDDVDYATTYDEYQDVIGNVIDLAKNAQR